MKLEDAFSSIAHKRLVRVDLPGQGSHQHELNGIAALQRFFQTSDRLEGPMTWIRFVEGEQPTSESGRYTFYDARARSAAITGRSPEWRLYYTSEPLVGSKPGDLLVLVRTRDDAVYALVFENDSGWERAALQLFPIGAGQNQQLASIAHQTLADTDLNILRRALLDQLGFDYVLPESDRYTNLAVELFGLAFPSTAEMGRVAREYAEPGNDSPDALLMSWMDTEEALFRALERVIVGERIEQGFADVDEFLSFSLSVQNRRKSRMGHAFEHHLSAVFEYAGVAFSSQVRTEGNRTADFVFPGYFEYRDPGYPSERLTVLAAKSTCKDRWPQVLADADRVKVKHLGTLDLALSDSQLRDMGLKSVKPVMPASVRDAYGASTHITDILELGEFIELVAAKQE